MDSSTFFCLSKWIPKSRGLTAIEIIPSLIFYDRSVEMPHRRHRVVRRSHPLNLLDLVDPPRQESVIPNKNGGKVIPTKMADADSFQPL